MNTTHSTFEVSHVPRATEPLPEIPYLRAIDCLLSQPFRLKKQRLMQEIGWWEHAPTDAGDDINEWLPQLKHQLAMLEAEEATATRPLEACSRYHGQLVADVLAHPVMVALHRAFTQHCPLASPPT